MTAREFSNEFDIHYDNISSNQAPGLDLYEKSVYLTEAQLEIIKNYFNPLGNKYRKGFEQTSKRRVDLKELIIPHTSKSKVDNIHSISSNSITFSIPSDVYLIVQETAKVLSDDNCINGEYIKVVPKTYDEYEIQKDNPFKKPNKEVIWRLDLYSLNTGIPNVELITSEKDISEYKFRYVKYPEPIILTDLDISFPGEGLSIDNKLNKQTCKLHQSVHREILNRAVEIALSDYKPEGLQSRIQMNSRNE